MTADIYEKAHTLAAAIAASQELSELRTSEKDMLENEEAQLLISDYQDVQQKLAEHQDGEPPAELRSTVAAIEEKLESNAIISRYLIAQDRFTEMLDEINSILASGIASDSETPGDVNAGCATCGGGCSTDGCL